MPIMLLAYLFYNTLTRGRDVHDHSWFILLRSTENACYLHTKSIQQRHFKGIVENICTVLGVKIHAVYPVIEICMPQGFILVPRQPTQLVRQLQDYFDFPWCYGAVASKQSSCTFPSPLLSFRVHRQAGQAGHMQLLLYRGIPFLRRLPKAWASESDRS